MDQRTIATNACFACKVSRDYAGHSTLLCTAYIINISQRKCPQFALSSLHGASKLLCVFNCVCIRSPGVNPSGHMQTAVVSLQLAAHKTKGQLAEQFIRAMSLFSGSSGAEEGHCQPMREYQRRSRSESLSQSLSLPLSNLPPAPQPSQDVACRFHIQWKP